MEKLVHTSKIVKIGPNAKDFIQEDMVIFFNENVPSYLADYCYLLDDGEGQCIAKAGDSIKIGEECFKITAVGDVAMQNYASLGHLVIRFDGNRIPIQPGTIHVERKEIPSLKVGTAISIVVCD
ncbi:MAG TPA: PTS glucitol/sorbitol transporter subunit IIA [Syntrophomonas sp.]|nr:PTS glucitol/sorbitol transporter subunit IIA [Syntrophomonas sp.]